MILNRNCCLLKCVFRGNKTVTRTPSLNLFCWVWNFTLMIINSSACKVTWRRSIAETQSVIKNNLAVSIKGGSHIKVTWHYLSSNLTVRIKGWSHVKDARLDFLEKIRMGILFFRFLRVLSTCTQIYFVSIGHQQEESTCRIAVLDESWTDSRWKM